MAARFDTKIWSVAIYILSIAACFSLSATYHVLARAPRSQRVMQRVDHAAINMLIAGTGTPVYIHGVGGRFGLILCATTWLIALSGAVLKGLGRGWRVASAGYLINGWLCAVAIPAVASNSLAGATLLIAGGVIYSTGAVLFWIHKPVLSPATFGSHELWHVMTIVAGGAHYSAVWLILAA